MKKEALFREQIEKEYYQKLLSYQESFKESSRVKIDLHCHDYNSDVPDELWGRILKLPETWITSKELIATLEKNGCQAHTITNHNNARSCWDLLDKGRDILVGAEFTCTFIEENSQFHVLAYGFTPEQEVRLNRYRKDLLRFLAYAVENDIPTVLPHPLYLYSTSKNLSLILYEKLALLFQRFEVLNGQRDLWQNLLTWRWLNSIDEEKIALWEMRHGINSRNFCAKPSVKFVTGGSDDHLGIMAGSSGTYLHVNDLATVRKNKSWSQIALEAIKEGRTSPFGDISTYEKLNLAFMNYLIQVVLNMKEPGLVRMLLHNGSALDKFACFAISNGIQELQRHKFTMRFLKIFHDGIKGKRPGFLVKRNISSTFKPIVEQLDRVALYCNQDRKQYLEELQNIIPSLYSKLSLIISKKVEMHKEKTHEEFLFPKDTQSFIERFEIPSSVRALLGKDKSKSRKSITQINLGEFLDDLSFPALTTMVLATSSFMSTRVMYGNRSFLNRFANKTGSASYPKRALWLTDTFGDKNGVSNCLGLTLRYVQENDCPIDFLICSNTVEEQSHLHVVKPVSSFSFSKYSDQIVNIPDLLEIQRLVIDGGYDRIICSTEIVMGLISIFLKESLHIKSYFYMHTDWLKFISESVTDDTSMIDRMRRILRLFYQRFDKVFVLNEDHKRMLGGPAFQIDPNKIKLTGHWPSPHFYPRESDRSCFRGRISADDFVLLFVGRVSREKGVCDLPKVYNDACKTAPKVKLVVVGDGPDRQELEKELPDATFLGWVKDKDELAQIYSNSDLLVLPSRFDTFGNVVLEAMSCGLPTAAYNEKGPKEIIQNHVYGILADQLEDLSQKICDYVVHVDRQKSMRSHVVMRSKTFNAQAIMDRLLSDVGLKKKTRYYSANFSFQENGL